MLAYAGFCVYLDFGLKIPKSGAERNYLSRVYRKPKNLAVVVFAMYSISLGVSSGNCFAFGTYVLLALGYTEPNPWVARIIALLILSAVCAVHALFPRLGRSLFNFLGVTKVIVLIGISLSGAAVLVGLYKPVIPEALLTNITNTPIPPASSYSVSVALLRVFYSYRGWENGNFVLGEIHKPERTLRFAGPVAIALATSLYLLCNASYFSVVPAELVQSSGTIIAGTFFRILFSGTSFSKVADTVLPLLVAISNLGNVIVVTYGHGHMNKEFAKHGMIPKWFAKCWPEEIDNEKSEFIQGLRTSREDSVDGNYGSILTSSIEGEDSLSKDLDLSLSADVENSAESPIAEDYENEDDDDDDDEEEVKSHQQSYISSPVTGIFLHWLASALTLILPPPGKIYNFIIDLSAYPGAMVATLVSLGLVYLRTHPDTEKWPSKPYNAPWAAMLIYLLVNFSLVIIPLVPPPKGQFENSNDMPFWAVPVATLAVLTSGLLYWRIFFKNKK